MNENSSTPQGVSPQAKKRRKKIVKRIILIVVLLAVAAAIALLLMKLFSKKPVDQTPMTDFTYIGSLSSKVTGNGVTQASDTATVAATVSGAVTNLFADVGDTVRKGDVLLTIDPADANTQIKAAEEVVSGLSEQVDELYGQMAEINSARSRLTVTADHDGKIVDIAVQPGEMVSEGQVLANLVVDDYMLLTQYFSYDYADLFYEGQQVTVRLPEGFEPVTAEITDVTMIEKITLDGVKLFEVTATIWNPGNLTEGQEANILLKTGTRPVPSPSPEPAPSEEPAESETPDGEGLEPAEADAASAPETSPAPETQTVYEDVYATPYESGVLAYYRKTPVVARASGTCSASYMKEYLPISEGSTLVVLKDDGYDTEIRSLNSRISDLNAQIAAARKDVEDKRELLKGYECIAPIDGTVVSSTFAVGQDVNGASMLIQNDDVMILSAQIDELDVGKVSVGMQVEISQYDEKFYTGTISEISMVGQNDMGYSYFPAKIIIDNDGTLMSGMYCTFTAVSSQIDDCVIAPVQAVKYTEMGPCLFVRSDTQPENAIELDEDVVPDGFWAVPVEVGISDDYGAQILSGVDADTEVFTSYSIASASSFEMMG